MFKNGNGSNRDIAIEISEDYIEFFFAINVKRHKEYLQYMEETEQTLSEEEKQFNSFYTIPKNEWIKDRTERLDRGDNWHTHMKEKNWFTKEMEDFINSKTTN